MKEDLMLRKEGLYWTLYLGEESMGCGFLEDMTDTLKEVAERLDNGEKAEEIVEEFNEFR